MGNSAAMRRRGIIRGGLKVRSINMKLHDALRKICSDTMNVRHKLKNIYVGVKY